VFLSWLFLLLLPDLLLHCLNDHPHSNQLGFESLYLRKQLILLFAKIDACPPTVRVKLRMIGLAVGEPEPRNVLSTSEVVVFEVLRTAAETLLRTIGTMFARSLRFHAAPPASER
jgi:hypothetical protein